ncbi:MAG: hypothetical protein MUC69_09955 [Gemmatimonadales bacterium]|jgi:hypothetical protein|nr:hypothetical protein [Gemmatimonadales bacterium]
MRPPRNPLGVLARVILSLTAIIVLATARLPQPVGDAMSRSAPTAQALPGAVLARVGLALLLLAALAHALRRPAWR